MKGILLLILILLEFLCVEILLGAAVATCIVQPPSLENQFPAKGSFQLPITWRGLVPLCTTRPEAERVLGQPKDSGVSPYIYENETERVDVLYSAERCGSGSGRWDVPPNTVIGVDVYPRKTLLLQDLAFDKTKYIRQNWSHPKDWVTYRNKKDGIWVETTRLDDKIEEVRRIRYLPKSVDEHLKCKE